MAANHASIKESNLTLVAEELFSAGGGLSRADLATRTGLTRATVSRLVKQLIELGLVTEASPDFAGSVGRPGTPLFPAAQTIVGIGLEVNADRVCGAAVDLTGNTVDSFSVHVDLMKSKPEDAFSLLSQHTGDMLGRLTEEGVTDISAYYLAVPGVVDEESKRIVYAPNLAWNDVYPERYLHGLLEDVSFAVDNDANLQAVAVAATAAGPEYESPSFLYLTGDVGIGGALVLQGTIDRGPHGWAGEIGHVTVEPFGPDCHCGSRGCLERYAGKQAILKEAGLPEDTETTELVRELKLGNPSVVAAVERAAWALGIALSSAVNLLDIDHIVLGTSLAPLLPWLKAGLTEEFDRRIVGRSSADVTVVAAPKLDLPAVVGGALQSLQGVLEARVGSPAR